MTHTTAILAAFENKLRRSRLKPQTQARVYTLLKDAISDIKSRRRTTPLSKNSSVQAVLKRVAKAAEMETRLLREGNKGEALPARQLAMYLLRQHGHTLIQIGRLFDRDHTTVISSVKTVSNRLETNDPITTALFNKYNELV